MAPPGPTPRIRKRNRKRKRRNVSSSSSSSSSSEEDVQLRVNTPSPEPSAAPVRGPEHSDSGSESSSSSASSSSSSSSVKPSKISKTTEATPLKASRHREPPSRSPSPPGTVIPPFVGSNPATDAEKEKEKALKEKFRKFWMASVADAFKDDLEEIRKESNLSTSRLSMLIDSLASGAEVFSANSTAQSRGNQYNDMEIVLGSP